MSVARSRLVESCADSERDVLRRRSTLWLEHDRGRVAATTVGATMARRLGWSPARARAEFQHYDGLLWEEETLIQRTQEAG